MDDSRLAQPLRNGLLVFLGWCAWVLGMDRILFLIAGQISGFEPSALSAPVMLLGAGIASVAALAIVVGRARFGWTPDRRAIAYQLLALMAASVYLMRIGMLASIAGAATALGLAVRWAVLSRRSAAAQAAHGQALLLMPAAAFGADVARYVLDWRGVDTAGYCLAALVGLGATAAAWRVLTRLPADWSVPAPKKPVSSAALLAMVIALCWVSVPAEFVADSAGRNGRGHVPSSGPRFAPSLSLATVGGVTRTVQGRVTPERSLHTIGLDFNVARPRCEVALYGVAKEADEGASVECSVYIQPEGEPQKLVASVPLALSATQWHSVVFDAEDYQNKKCRVTIGATGAEGLQYSVIFSIATYRARPEGAHNLLLISLGGLRADHLGSYGYSVPTSPIIDRVAAEGVRFERCNSQAPWALPSLFSMMSGEAPSVLWADQPLMDGQRRYVGNAPMLATILKSAAYHTVAVTEGGPARAEGGLAQGFDSYADVSPQRLEATTQYALTWLKDHATDWFFMFVQSHETNPPYRTGPFTPDGPGTRSRVIAGYDSSIAHMDLAVGSLMGELERQGVLDDTLVIITSAHGQDFRALGGTDAVWPGDVGVFGNSLRQSVLHVPLIMRAPRLLPAGMSVPEPVAAADVQPTALRLLDIPTPQAPAGRPGVDLTPIMRSGGVRSGERAIFSEAISWGPEQKAIMKGNYKLIVTPVSWDRLGEAERAVRSPSKMSARKLAVAFATERVSLFDLSVDPAEQRNISQAHPEIVAEYMKLLQDTLARNETLRQKNKPHVVGSGQTDQAAR